MKALPKALTKCFYIRQFTQPLPSGQAPGTATAPSSHHHNLAPKMRKSKYTQRGNWFCRKAVPDKYAQKLSFHHSIL